MCRAIAVLLLAAAPALADVMIARNDGGLIGPITTLVCQPPLQASRAGSTATIFYDGGLAPTDATYLTQSPSASLSAEFSLSTLASGILRNHSDGGTSVQSIYPGDTCDAGYFVSAVSASGFLTCTAAATSSSADAGNWVSPYRVTVDLLTTNATPTVAYTYSLPFNTQVTSTVTGVATQTDVLAYPGQDNWGTFRSYASFACTLYNSGVVTGTTTTAYGAAPGGGSFSYAAGADCGASDGTYFFKVTGVSGQRIHWHLEFELVTRWLGTGE